jgi:hypothetical protein
MWVPSSLSLNTLHAFSRTCFFFLSLVSSNEGRYRSINYICKLEYYYVLQVYWELAVFGVANWRQSQDTCSNSNFAGQTRVLCFVAVASADTMVRRIKRIHC